MQKKRWKRLRININSSAGLLPGPCMTKNSLHGKFDNCEPGDDIKAQTKQRQHPTAVVKFSESEVLEQLSSVSAIPT